MRSVMLQCPKSSPRYLLEMQRACPAAVTAREPGRCSAAPGTRAEPYRGEDVGCPRRRGGGTSPYCHPLLWNPDQDGGCWTCRPPHIRQGHPQPGHPSLHPMRPSQQPGDEDVARVDPLQPSAAAAAGGRHLGAPQRQVGAQPGLVHPPGALAPLPRSCRLPAHGAAWPRRPTAGLQLRVPPWRWLPPPRPVSLRVLPSCACE